MRFIVTKRIGAFFLALVLLFTLTFGFLNRPIKTHADVLSALALGSGALGALVCAYMATAGIQITGGSSGADGSFLGNYVANWVKSSSSFPNNGYFNSQGEFIGNNTDLSIVQNTDTGLVSFIFGKEFAIWLEALKSSFVSDHNLTVGSSSPLISQDYLILNSVPIGILPQASSYPYDGTIPNFINFSTTNDQRFRYASSQGGFVIGLSNVTPSSYSIYYIPVSSSGSYGSIVRRTFSSSLSSNSINDISGIYLTYTNNNQINVSILTLNAQRDSVIINQNLGTLNAYLSSDKTDISLDGSLTDGYQDFEDAINNDLTNADEEEVVVVDVGTFPEVMDPSLLVPDILDRAITGSLNPEYDGTRENTESAEDEKEGEKPFSPTVPEGWVIVNGLEDFFPFCIPWDLYNLISELNVPAEAPKFKYNINLNAAIDGLEYEAELDLAPFETVAIVFRIFICIGFVFFLIMKTRDLIRG